MPYKSVVVLTIVLLMAGTAQNTQQFEANFKKQNAAPMDVSMRQLKVANAEEPQNSLRLRNASEGNTRLMKPIANLDTFLQLAKILTILLCGIAIALTSQRFVQQNQDHIALLRCMGAASLQILWAYLSLLGVVFLLAMLVGSAVGVGLGYGLLQLMLQLIPHLSIAFQRGICCWADSDCHVDQCRSASGFCLTRSFRDFEYLTDPSHSQPRKIGFVYVLDVARRNG